MVEDVNQSHSRERPENSVYNSSIHRYFLEIQNDNQNGDVSQRQIDSLINPVSLNHNTAIS